MTKTVSDYFFSDQQAQDKWFGTGPCDCDVVASFWKQYFWVTNQCYTGGKRPGFIVTTRKRSYGKVMFLLMFVCPQGDLTSQNEVGSQTPSKHAHLPTSRHAPPPPPNQIRSTGKRYASILECILIYLSIGTLTVTRLGRSCDGYMKKRMFLTVTVWNPGTLSRTYLPFGMRSIDKKVWVRYVWFVTQSSFFSGNIFIEVNASPFKSLSSIQSTFTWSKT